MSSNMKIALLNLPIDDNYGGNLQRFALVKVLQFMGCDVTHLLIMRRYSIWRWHSLLAIPKRIILRFIFKRNIHIFAERAIQKNNINNYENIKPFYDKYVKHTDFIYNCKDIKKYKNFDAYIVGSDQVWRKKIVRPFPLEMFFLNFTRNSGKKIAYAISLGTNEFELKTNEAQRLKKLYEKFTAVSVREKTALNIFDCYDWKKPKAEWLLDPTLLLKKEDYQNVINDTKTYRMEGDMFCYILDMTEEKMEYIHRESSNRKVKPFIVGLHKITIEQWLRNIRDAKFIVTDSYHGFVFSMIFNKPVKLFFNDFRGNARFESLLDLLGVSKNQYDFDWLKINRILDTERKKSLNWIKTALGC